MNDYSDLIEECERGVREVGLSEDNCSELYDIEAANEVMAHAAAAIRALMAEREWRPIESAPRDGTEILCWPGLRKPETAVTGAWLDTRGGPCWVDLGVGHHNGYWRPTHWLPLPKGPTA